MPYVWDYVPSYRLNQAGLLKYLHTIFPADSNRRRVRFETLDEDHYRVYIPRQLTKEERSDASLEKFRWGPGSDDGNDPFEPVESHRDDEKKPERKPASDVDVTSSIATHSMVKSSSVPQSKKDSSTIPTSLSDERVTIEVAQNIKQPFDDDIESLVSYHDDTSSQISSRTNNVQLAGKTLLGAFLADEPDFNSICEVALGRMDRLKFERNMSRLLKTFQVDLSLEAKTEVHKATASLLLSKRGRDRMSKQIVNRIETSEDDPVADRRILGPDRDQKKRIEDWLEKNHEATQINAPNEVVLVDDYDLATGSDDNSDNDPDHSSEHDSNFEFPHISDLEAYVGGTRAFAELRKNLMLFLVPVYVMNVLQVVPKENIWFSEKQDFSLGNRVKAWVEDKTQVRWQWWPLSSRKRVLGEDETRMFWRCHCGSILWREMSIEQSRWVQRILVLSRDERLLPPVCTPSRWNPGAWFRRASSEVPPAANPSLAARRYTPSNDTGATSSADRGGTSTNRKPLESSADRPVPLTETKPKELTSSSPTAWILLGVQGWRRTLVPTQIEIFDDTVDYLFFRQFRECYRSRRGRLRLWLSVWQLDHCDVVKYTRLDYDQMVREHREFPTDQDYSYTPRDGSAKNPPFSSHAFGAVFHSCDWPCTRRGPHECIKPKKDKGYLCRLPKRKDPFDQDSTDEIWGLGAVHAVSFAYVYAYHIVIIGSPFAFFGWWVATFPNDLQNASVPMSIVLGLLALFHTGSGIWTSRKED